MTVFELLKSKNAEELSEWLDEYCHTDFAPWISWWDRNYCNKCDSVYYDGDKNEYGWCEVYNKCRYFQNMNEIPNHKQIIKMWLESYV